MKYINALLTISSMTIQNANEYYKYEILIQIKQKLITCTVTIYADETGVK